MTQKEKSATVDYLESLINALESRISITEALKITLSAVPKAIKEKAEEVYRLNRSGRTLYDSFILAGFPKKYFFILQPFERDGNFVEGLKAVKELLSIDVRIESELSQIDLYVLITVVIVIVTAALMLGYYAPVMGKLLSEVVDNPESLTGLAGKLASMKDLTVKDVIFSYQFIGASLFLLFVWKTKLYRKFLGLLPSYRKLVKLSDKTAITTAFALSRNYRLTVKVLSESFGDKYRLREIDRGFSLGANFDAFEISDLFDDEEEKKLFILAGANNFSHLFNYLKNKYNREREKLFGKIKTYMEIFVIAVMVLAIVVMAALMGIPMNVIIKNLKF